MIAKKRLLPILVAVMMVFAMMPIAGGTVFAAESEYDLWIAGVQVTDENAADLSVIDGVTGSASYDDSTKTLTLNGASIDNSIDGQMAAGIQYMGDGDFKIIANGTNTVSVSAEVVNSDNGARSAGIVVGDLMSANLPPTVNLIIDISAGGSLSVSSGKATGKYYPESDGITNKWRGNITIQGEGTLTAIGGECSNWSYGILTNNGNVVFNSMGSVLVSGDPGSDSNGILVPSGNTTEINSGTVQVTGSSSAFKRAPTLGERVTALGSTDITGSAATEYIAESFSSYKWFKSEYVPDTRTEIEQLTFSVDKFPLAGQSVNDVGQAVTVEEEGVSVVNSSWLDCNNRSPIEGGHVFSPGETVTLMIDYELDIDHKLAEDIESKTSVNGEAATENDVDHTVVYHNVKTGLAAPNDLAWKDTQDGRANPTWKSVAGAAEYYIELIKDGEWAATCCIPVEGGSDTTGNVIEDTYYVRNWMDEYGAGEYSFKVNAACEVDSDKIWSDVTSCTDTFVYRGIVTSIDISNLTLPQEGGSPDTSSITTNGEAAGYKVDFVNWIDSDANVVLKPEDTFKIGTKYCFDIKISPASSRYYFPKDKYDVSVTVNGKNYACEDATDIGTALWWCGNEQEWLRLRVYYKVPEQITVPSGKTLTYNGKAQAGVTAGENYTVSGNTAMKAGSYTATASLKYKEFDTWADGTTADKNVKWKINKAANPLKISPKTAKVKYNKLKRKTQTLAVTKVIKFTKKLNDKKTYTLVSAKKGSKSFKKYFKINKKTGKVTVKKGLKKGTYKVKVKVKAAGNANYKAATKTVTFKIKIK